MTRIADWWTDLASAWAYFCDLRSKRRAGQLTEAEAEEWRDRQW